MPQLRRRKGVKTLLAVDEIDLYSSILSTYLSSCNHEDADLLNGFLKARRYDLLLEWTELNSKSPQMYGSAASYYATAQIVALIKKYPFNDGEVSGLNPELTALKKFRAAEHRCKRVNQRFRARRNNKRFHPHAQFWHDARSYIERVIGREPDISSILSKCDFTAGASIGVHGNATNLARKLYASEWTSTPTALPYAITALWNNVHARDCLLPGVIKCYDPDEFRGLVRQRVQRVDCNNITFVPKTAKTHRSIAVEPLLNGFVQKGVDVYMREKLRMVNIDLNDQTPNQVLAFTGSLGGPDPFSTIDLAAASDSLAIEVVRDLLPPAWFDFLSDIRSPWYAIHGSTARYEKFCSMGNGFCFPLQTLVFASVCHAALVQTRAPRKNFAVYGDDIIVPQHAALLVIERLRDLGFTTNRDKTFVTGPFRESCGRDWFQGQDVRPVSLDKRMSDIRHLCAFHNTTLRSQWTTISFEEVRAHLRTFAPYLVRPGVEPGDTCFSVPLDDAMTSPWVRWRREGDAKHPGQCWSWREITSSATADDLDSLQLSVQQHANAVAYAVLSGSDSGKPFTLRYTTVARTRIVARPHWERIRSVFGYLGPVRLGPECR